VVFLASVVEAGLAVPEVGSEVVEEVHLHGCGASTRESVITS
jgi:hypothetical protein